MNPLTRPQVAAYGLLGLPLAFAALPVYVYAPKFYAGLGLSLAASGAILLVARLADAFIDPWLGAWSDRARQKKRFIALFLIPLGAGMVGLFHPPATTQVALTLWLCACLGVVYLGFSAANIAYQAWGARIAPDPHTRTLVTASREGLGLFGVVLASLLPQGLAPAANPTVEAGLAQASEVFIGILALCAIVTLNFTPVGNGPQNGSSSASSGDGRADAPVVPVAQPASGLLDTLASARLRRLLAVFALNGIASSIPATLFLFFVADVLHAQPSSGRFLALYFVAAACALPLWVQVARRVGKRRAWLASMLLAVAAFAWAYLLGTGDSAAFTVICIASGVALGADLALPPSMLADVIERDAASGREGAYFGVWNLVTKLNLALAAGLALPALAWAGYQPGAGNVVALAVAYCLVPCVLKLCAAVLLWRSTFDLQGN